MSSDRLSITSYPLARETRGRDDLIREFLTNIFKGFALWRKSKNHAELMEFLRIRVVFSCVLGILLFSTISYRLFDTMIVSKICLLQGGRCPSDEIVKKADILDRNGEILATSITTASCYADPSVVIDIDDTANKISSIKGMPSFEKIKQKLVDKTKHFAWIARHITPQVQQTIMDLGLPGILFQKDYKRIYPHASLFSHIVGCCDVDGVGVCGIEKRFNNNLITKDFSSKRLFLSFDLRVQSIVHEELLASVEKYAAIGGNAILMKIDTGEVLSMVSLPDFDPNHLKTSSSEALFNRNTLGVFEPGSTFKILNVAIALEEKTATLGSMFDASAPIRLGRFSIKDFRGKCRPLSLAEAFVFSSNIASVKISQTFGPKTQKNYMKKFGVLDKISLEVPEVGAPIFPAQWSEATATTVSYGYGVSVSPMQLLSAVSSIVNDGERVYPTFLYDPKIKKSDQVVSQETSAIVRDLMRGTVCFGTAKKASVEGLGVFGKTGTAYKMSGRGYGAEGNRARITTFIGGFPKSKPEYMLIVMLDNPKAIDGTHGYATAGWNAAPTAGEIFKRIAPIISSGPSELEESELQITKYINLK